MFFSDYKEHPDAKVNPNLLWEYYPEVLTKKSMRNAIVNRVVERGTFNDFYAIFHLYGEDGVIQAIKEIGYLNDKDMKFVNMFFDIPLNELKCWMIG